MFLDFQENVDREFFKNRYMRQNGGKAGGPVAPGWNAAQGEGGASAAGGAGMLTPAESSLLKTLTGAAPEGTEDGARGVGVGGKAGLDRLMRVMINAPDVSFGPLLRPSLFALRNSASKCHINVYPWSQCVADV